MTNQNKDQGGDRKSFRDGYQPIKEGYQPNQGNLDTSNPPGGEGSGTGGSSGREQGGGDSNSEGTDSQQR
jgi:hypothetical protein